MPNKMALPITNAVTSATANPASNSPIQDQNTALIKAQRPAPDMVEPSYLSPELFRKYRELRPAGLWCFSCNKHLQNAVGCGEDSFQIRLPKLPLFPNGDLDWADRQADSPDR